MGSVGERGRVGVVGGLNSGILLVLWEGRRERDDNRVGSAEGVSACGGGIFSGVEWVACVGLCSFSGLFLGGGDGLKGLGVVFFLGVSAFVKGIVGICVNVMIEVFVCGD